MSQEPQTSMAEKLADHTLIDAAIRRAVREAILAHAKAGNPVATWRDGKVVWVPPEEILRDFANEAKKDEIQPPHQPVDS